jgi:hypothetical protein
MSRTEKCRDRSVEAVGSELDAFVHLFILLLDCIMLNDAIRIAWMRPSSIP